MGTSKLDFGSGPGDGFTLADSNGGDFFYIEITGVGFQGQREGVLFRLGRDDHADAYNSCTLAFGTNNGSPDATAACRLNHVLNTRHFGVHNTSGVSRSNSDSSSSGASEARRAADRDDRWSSRDTHWRTSWSGSTSKPARTAFISPGRTVASTASGCSTGRTSRGRSGVTTPRLDADRCRIYR